MLFVTLLANGLAIGLLYGLIGLGFTLVFRTAGLLNLSHGELVMFGGLVGFTVLTATSLPILPAMLVVMVVVGVIAVLTELLVFRPIRQRGGREVNAVIASVGLLLVFIQIGLLVWGAQPLSYPPQFTGAPVIIGTIILPSQIIWIGALGLAVMIALQLFLRYTLVGVTLRSVADDREMSQLLGVNSNRTTTQTFLVSGMLAGASGLLLGSLYHAYYNMGLIGIKGFAAAVLGGLGSVPGAALGGIVLGISESFGTVYMSSAFRDVIAYGILIIILLIRPQGLLGTVIRKDS